MERIAKYSLRHAKDFPFKAEGLRDFFAYRDLGMVEATGGRFRAQVARAVKACDVPTGRHVHNLDFQFIYILKGWLTAEYEGIGTVKMEAGACLHNPPGNPHEVLAFSEDLEFLELTTPAEYETVEV